MNISEHITYEEATGSPTAKRMGIENIPNDHELSNMKVVAEYCFEPLRKWYGKPIRINSFFRCEALNKAVGGSRNSQHRFGEAIDLTGGSKEENRKIFEWCKANLIFDQLINEYNFSWVHISFRNGQNRNQVLEVK